MPASVSTLKEKHSSSSLSRREWKQFIQSPFYVGKTVCSGREITYKISPLKFDIRCVLECTLIEDNSPLKEKPPPGDQNGPNHRNQECCGHHFHGRVSSIIGAKVAVSKLQMGDNSSNVEFSKVPSPFRVIDLTAH